MSNDNEPLKVSWPGFSGLTTISTKPVTATETAPAKKRKKSEFPPGHVLLSSVIGTVGDLKKALSDRPDGEDALIAHGSQGTGGGPIVPLIRIFGQEAATSDMKQAEFKGIRDAARRMATNPDQNARLVITAAAQTGDREHRTVDRGHAHVQPRAIRHVVCVLGPLPKPKDPQA